MPAAGGSGRGVVQNGRRDVCADQLRGRAGKLPRGAGGFHQFPRRGRGRSATARFIKCCGRTWQLTNYGWREQRAGANSETLSGERSGANSALLFGEGLAEARQPADAREAFSAISGRNFPIRRCARRWNSPSPAPTSWNKTGPPPSPDIRAGWNSSRPTLCGRRRMYALALGEFPGRK